jgi:enoyl-CoA hydratase/carnithine racemase
MTMSYEHIEVNYENGLGTITLNRPPVNVLNIAMMEEINDAHEGLKAFMEKRRPEWKDE